MRRHPFRRYALERVRAKLFVTLGSVHTVESPLRNDGGTRATKTSFCCFELFLFFLFQQS